MVEIKLNSTPIHFNPHKLKHIQVHSNKAEKNRKPMMHADTCSLLENITNTFSSNTSSVPDAKSHPVVDVG